MKKCLALLLAAMMLFTLAACGNESAQTNDNTTEPTDAPVDYTAFCGTYALTYPESDAQYSLTIASADNTTGELEFSISFYGENADPIYNSKPIVAAVGADNTVQFDWTDSWSNKGEGTLVLNPDDTATVQLLMTVTEEAEFNRATLSTHDEYRTLTRK